MARFEVVACASVEFPVTPSVPATWTLPAESIVVVADCPKRAVFPVTAEEKKLVEVADVAVSDAKAAVPVKVGEVEKTTDPLPVSSESQRLNCAEFAKSEEVEMSE